MKYSDSREEWKMYDFKMDHFAISVSDADRSKAFYEKLGFSIVKDYEAEDKSVRILHMEMDGVILELFCYPDSTPVPDFTETVAKDLKVRGAKHMGLMAADLNEAARYLMEEGLIDEMPQIRAGRLGRDYFFIKDPDGINVEIILAR